MSAIASDRAIAVEDPFGGPGGGSIETREVCAWFGKNYVLDRVSLTMPSRRVTALIGPSGCGKSTFLRTLNRMHELIPNAMMAGQVELDGIDIYGRNLAPTATRLKIGMVFQKPNPFPQSIYDNVAFGPRVLGLTDHLAQRVQQSLESVALWSELGGSLREPAQSLSLGQQQRLCIARVLAVEPEVILMDEPCSALDPMSTLRIEELVRELKARYTIVIVTHNMQQAARVSDVTAFFWLGRLVECGRTDRMFTAPSEKLTEDYVTGRFG